MREVRCLTQAKKHSHQCDLNTQPEQEQICNPIPCSPQVSGWFLSWRWGSVQICSSVSISSSLFADENCRDRHHNCVMVVQARLCVYFYYKNACCASCTQSAQRAKRHWPARRHNIRRPRCARSQGLGQNGGWQACRNGQPRVDIIPAVTVRKHLAIFSWFLRHNTVKVVGFTTLYAISYHLSELHIPLSLRHFTLCIILNNRFTLCRTELCDVSVIILSLFAAWEIVMEGAYWGHSCVSTANLDSLWSTES